MCETESSAVACTITSSKRPCSLELERELPRSLAGAQRVRGADAEGREPRELLRLRLLARRVEQLQDAERRASERQRGRDSALPRQPGGVSADRPGLGERSLGDLAGRPEIGSGVDAPRRDRDESVLAALPEDGGRRPGDAGGEPHDLGGRVSSCSATASASPASSSAGRASEEASPATAKARSTRAACAAHSSAASRCSAPNGSPARNSSSETAQPSARAGTRKNRVAPVSLARCDARRQARERDRPRAPAAAPRPAARFRRARPRALAALRRQPPRAARRHRRAPGRARSRRPRPPARLGERPQRVGRARRPGRGRDRAHERRERRGSEARVPRVDVDQAGHRPEVFRPERARQSAKRGGRLSQTVPPHIGHGGSERLNDGSVAAVAAAELAGDGRPRDPKVREARVLDLDLYVLHSHFVLGEGATPCAPVRFCAHTAPMQTPEPARPVRTQAERRPRPERATPAAGSWGVRLAWVSGLVLTISAFTDWYVGTLPNGLTPGGHRLAHRNRSASSSSSSASPR